MKSTKFSDEQMVKILREADKSPVAEVARAHGVSDKYRYIILMPFYNYEV